MTDPTAMAERQLDGEDLAYFERQVVDLVKQTLQRPLPARLIVFEAMTEAGRRAMAAAEWKVLVAKHAARGNP